MLTQETAEIDNPIDNPLDFIEYWNLTRREAATVFEVDYVTVRRWCCGDRKPDRGFCLAAKLMHQLWKRDGKPSVAA